jgi:hypothetical protein
LPASYPGASPSSTTPSLPTSSSPGTRGTTQQCYRAGDNSAGDGLGGIASTYTNEAIDGFCNALKVWNDVNVLAILNATFYGSLSNGISIETDLNAYDTWVPDACGYGTYPRILEVADSKSVFHQLAASKYSFLILLMKLKLLIRTRLFNWRTANFHDKNRLCLVPIEFVQTVVTIKHTKNSSLAGPYHTQPSLFFIYLIGGGFRGMHWDA